MSTAPVWLIRSRYEPNTPAWVYKVICGPESVANAAGADIGGILPWGTLPGMKRVASDYMNGERKETAVIGISVGEEWAEWNLPCPPPPVPGLGRGSVAARESTGLRRPPGTRSPIVAVRLAALLRVAVANEQWDFVPMVFKDTTEEEWHAMLALAAWLAAEGVVRQGLDLGQFCLQLGENVDGED